jgi:steroid delta-isomerase
MTDLTAAVERHCELFNECVRTGDWAPFTASLADDARMAFTDVPVGPFEGREQIAVAYAEQPPTDTLTLEAVETLDPHTARALFVWDNSGEDGVMVLRWHDGRVAAIEVTFSAQATST